MNIEEERTKLAEAMNISLVIHEVGQLAREWNPFTDANDDYAVLEWLRSRPESEWDQIEDAASFGQLDYQIGDYARAALKVL